MTNAPHIEFSKDQIEAALSTDPRMKDYGRTIDQSAFGNCAQDIWEAIQSSPIAQSHPTMGNRDMALAYEPTSDGDDFFQIQVRLPNGTYLAQAWRCPLQAGLDTESRGLELAVDVAGILIQAVNETLDALWPAIVVHFPESAKEIQPDVSPIELTDAQLETAIRTSEVWGAYEGSMVAEDGIVVGDMTDQYDGDPDQFCDAVDLVWIAVSQGPLDHTHKINLVWDANPTGEAQLQVTLPEEGYVAASWRDPSELTDDNEATGITGLVAIARALVRAANRSLDIARPLVIAQLGPDTKI